MRDYCSSRGGQESSSTATSAPVLLTVPCKQSSSLLLLPETHLLLLRHAFQHVDYHTTSQTFVVLLKEPKVTNPFFTHGASETLGNRPYPPPPPPPPVTTRAAAPLFVALAAPAARTFHRSALLNCFFAVSSAMRGS